MIELAPPGEPVATGDPWPFRCHPGLACFNACCRDKRLPLLPYDVLRLARGVGCRTDVFLAERATLEIDPASGWPALRITLAGDGRCPYVRDEGCSVYADRPTCCRIYPLARAVRLGSGGPEETFVVAAGPDRCGGFGAPARIAVAGWIEEQGLGPYRAANDRSAALFLDPRRPRPMRLEPEDVHAVVLALYNVDVFRESLQRPGAASRLGVAAAALERALESDEALLDLGHAWLAKRLFG
jgi:Fe-S-cluster containining protein